MCNRPTFCPAAVEQALRRTEAPLLEVKQVAQWRLRAEVTDTDLCTHTHTLAPHQRQASRHTWEIRRSLTWKFGVVQAVPFIGIGSDTQRLTLINLLLCE